MAVPDGKLVIQLPYQFITERLIARKFARSPFSQQATAFEDFIIRIVRYAFAKIPANIGISAFSVSFVLMVDG